MIEKSLTDEELKKTHFVFMNDFESNDDWVASMRETISKIAPGSSKITLVGHAHDASSFYLKLFPNWNFYLLDNQDEFPHATELRKSILAGRKDHIDYVDAKVAKILSKYKCQCDKYLDFVDRFETNKFKCLYCRECSTQINVSKNRNEGILSIFGESKGYRIRFLIEENKVDLFDLVVSDREFGIKLSTSIDQIKINPFNLKEEIPQLIEKLLTLSTFL
jgi:nicotinamide mononucleotide adenylyltransferase